MNLMLKRLLEIWVRGAIVLSMVLCRVANMLGDIVGKIVDDFDGNGDDDDDDDD